MTKLEEIDQKLYDRGITIHNVELATTKAASMRQDSIDNEDPGYAIFFNKKMMSCSAEERVAKEHELAHLETGSLYSLDTSLLARKRREYKADKHMIQKIMPIQELKKALTQGLERWEIAEEFDVTEELVKRACQIYKNMEML